MNSHQSYAVFSEHSPENKPMQAGMNTRVFTNIDAIEGDAIRLDPRTGVITLVPGTYHISGFSSTVYYAETDPPEMISTRDPANGGYCRVWNMKETTDLRDNAKAIVVGSASTANAVPSLFETYFTTDEKAEIILEHQSGSNVADVYLRVFTMDSPWHVFARIAIRRL
jgi:hypothetical protein